VIMWTPSTALHQEPLSQSLICNQFLFSSTVRVKPRHLSCFYGFFAY
jgi:hypothetical protein